ncbi:MFS transporter [Rhodovibrionaceae bacterium A322]
MSGTGSEQKGESLIQAVFLVFVPFAAGYFLSYVYRTVNAVISGRLITDLSLDASDLGLLTATYFLTFAAFQIPLGLLLDRYGPRRVQSALLLFAAAGAGLFAIAPSLELLILGRALIGLGVAGGLMASFKAITLWFPQDRWPLVNGCFLACGGLGAIGATVPVELVLGLTDWRGLFMGLALATALVSLFIFKVVPEKRETGKANSLREALRGLGEIYSNAFVWRILPFAVVFQAASLAIQGLWVGPWLRDVAGFSQDLVAENLFYVAVVFTLGAVGSGVVADRLERLGISIYRIMAGGALLFLTSQVLIVFDLLPHPVLGWLLFTLTTTTTMLAYPALSRTFPLHYAGRVNTAINLPVFVLAFSIQYAVGGILDLWSRASDGRYPEEGYDVAMGILLAIELLCFLWFIFSPAKPGAPGK